MMVFNAFLVPLFLTIVIEIFVAILLGNKQIQFLAAFVLVNVMTNPLLNYIVMVLKYFEAYHILILVIMEIIVVVCEWKALCYALNKKDKFLLRLSILSNTASFSVGVVLFNV